MGQQEVSAFVLCICPLQCLLIRPHTASLGRCAAIVMCRVIYLWAPKVRSTGTWVGSAA
jgi:hypothetical protein